MKHANSSKDGSGKREKPCKRLARKADFGVSSAVVSATAGAAVCCVRLRCSGFAVVDGAVFGNVIIRHKSLLIGTVRGRRHRSRRCRRRTRASNSFSGRRGIKRFGRAVMAKKFVARLQAVFCGLTRRALASQHQTLSEKSRLRRLFAALLRGYTKAKRGWKRRSTAFLRVM